MRDLTVGKESRLILQFAMPMLAANFFQQSYTFIDRIFVGNSHMGENGLAVIGNSFLITFLLIGFIIGISIGFNIVIAQYFGAKNIEKVKSAINTINIFIVFASVIVTIIGLTTSKIIFKLIGFPAELIPMAVSYLNVYFIGIFVFFGFNGICAVLRGLGDSKTPLYFIFISTVINIILDWWFIIHLKLNIEWVAIAAVISQAIVFIMAIIYLNKTHKIVKYSFSISRFDKEIFKQSLRIGLPSGLQQTFVAIGMIALMAIVNPFGKDVIAAFTIAGTIDSLASLPAMNFAAALSTFVGQNFGANKPERVKKGFTGTLLMTSLITITVTVIVIIFGSQLMDLFTDNTNVINIGVNYLIIVSSFYIIFTSMFIVGGVMRGAGATLIPMFITLFALWVVRIPASYLLSQKIGIDGIWWGIPIGWTIGLSLSVWYYLKGNWRSKVIIKPVVSPVLSE